MKNPIATHMLRHHIHSLQHTIEHYVYYAEVVRTRARNETDPTMREATLAESETYGESVEWLRCAIACLLDSEEGNPAWRPPNIAASVAAGARWR